MIMPDKILQMFCCLIVCIVTLVHAQFPDFCSRPSAVTSGEYTINHAKGGHWNVDTTTALIAMHETLCYKVGLISTTTGQEVERLYVVQYIGAEQHYPVLTAYNFSIPIISTECTCGCPNEGKSKCATVEQECRDAGNSTCTVVMETGQTPEGCVWVGGEATTCCVVRVSPDSSTHATILELSSFKSRLLFNITVLDLTNRKVKNETKTLPLLDSRIGVPIQLDEYFHITIKLDGGQKALIRKGYYIAQNDKVYHFLGDQLNGLNDWDFNKLGWYKVEGGMFKEESLQNAMKIRTSNCGQNKVKIEMNGRYFKVIGDDENSFKLTDNMVTLEKYFAARIGTVHSELRNVRVSALSTRRVSIDFKFKSKILDTSSMALIDNGREWLFDHCKLADFKASMVHDEYGNNVLEVNLSDAVGEIIGYIDSGITDEPHEDLTMHVPSFHDNYFIKQGVVTICGANTRVCLKASGFRSRNATCHRPSCTILSGKRFRPPNLYLTHTTIVDQSYLKLETWSSMGNPANWFDREFRYGELITAVLYLILIAIMIRLAVKSCRKMEARRRRREGLLDQEEDMVSDMNNYGEIKMRKLAVISESEGLEEFKNFKDVGYARSEEDMLNDGSRREDWSAPRRFSTASL